MVTKPNTFSPFVLVYVQFCPGVCYTLHNGFRRNRSTTVSQWIFDGIVLLFTGMNVRNPSRRHW